MIRYPDSDDPREWEWDTPTRLDDVIAAFRRETVAQQTTRRIQAWAAAEADRNFG